MEFEALGAAVTGIPMNGVNVHLSPGLKKKLDTVAGSSCNSGDHDRCYHGIREVLVHPETDLQVRQIGTLLLLGSWAAASISVFYMWLVNNDKQNKPDIHVPSAQLSQASSIFASSKSVVAIATGANVPFATITPKPSVTTNAAPALITPASVITQTADSGSYEKGDIVFSITESQARRWSGLVARSNTTTCDLARQHSRDIETREAHNPLLSNVLCGAEMLLANMLNQGPASALTGTLPLRFNWRDRDTNEAMHIIQGQARDYAADLHVDVQTADRWGIAAFTVARAVIIDRNTLIGDGTTPAPLSVPAVDIDLDHLPIASCVGVNATIGLAGCRMVGAIKACTTVYTNTSTCVDEMTTTSAMTVSTKRPIILTTAIVPWTVTDSDPYPEPTAEPTPAAQPPGVYVNQGNLKCNKNVDSGNAKKFVDLNMMNSAANFFCDQLVHNHTLLQPGLKVTEDPKGLKLNYNNNIGDPVYLSLIWGSDDVKCPSMDFNKDQAKNICMDRLGTIINECDTSNPKGLYWWKQGGTFYRDCITWTIRRDDWSHTQFATSGDNSNDAWRPFTRQCNADIVCYAAPKWCGKQESARCKFDSKTTDLGWCECPVDSN